MKADFNFRALLLKIQDFLSEDDRKRLHFLLGDDVPRYLRDDTSIGGALRVLDSLIEQARISEEDCDYLIEAFKNIQCYNASQRLEAYRKAHQQPWSQRSLSLQDVLRDVEEDRVSLIGLQRRKPESVVEVCPCCGPVDSTTPTQSPSDTANQIYKPLDTSYASRIRNGSRSTRKIVLPIIVVLILLASVLIIPYSLKSGKNLNCDAEMYKGQGNYSKALHCYEQLLKIQNKTLFPNHPAIATSYSNIGEMHYHMGLYPEALDYHKRSLQIRKESKLCNDTDLATSYNNIGLTYDKMGNYSLALGYYEESLRIHEKAEPPNNADLATSFNNIGLMYDKMRNYSRALYYYRRSLINLENSQSGHRAGLTDLPQRIALVCQTIENDSEAREYCERARRSVD